MNMQNMQKMRGFTMVEILVVLGLIGVFMLALAQIQMSEVRQSKAAQAHDSAAMRVDAAVKALRADMWEAESVHEQKIELDIQKIDGSWKSKTKPTPTHITIYPSHTKTSTISWMVLGDDHRLLRRMTSDVDIKEILPHPKNGPAYQFDDPSFEVQDFTLPATASIEAIHERFSFPGAWGGPGPIPYAIRLHIGDEQILLPNKGVLTYGFHVTYPNETKGEVK